MTYMAVTLTAGGLQQDIENSEGKREHIGIISKFVGDACDLCLKYFLSWDNVSYEIIFKDSENKNERKCVWIIVDGIIEQYDY